MIKGFEVAREPVGVVYLKYGDDTISIFSVVNAYCCNNKAAG